MKTVLTVTFAMSICLATLSLIAADASEPTTQPATTQPAATQPATTQPVSESAREEMSADKVIQDLLMSRSKQAVLPDTATAPADDAPTPAPKAMVKPLPTPPGAMIVNRTGRLKQDETTGWWQLHFESEKDVLYEAPIRVLPNRMLEAMEDILSRSGANTVLFKVTGEVTQYRGRRHLLIRRMLIKRDLGAL